MAENIIKTIQINPAGGDVQTRPIGAEAENVIISRGLDGKVIEDNAAISEVASTEGTAKWVNKSESNLIGDATIENTDVAKASHNEGTYFLWKGDLTRAKENIARNGAISSSNAEKVSLAGEIVSMKQTFQDGVNVIVDAIEQEGITPATLTPQGCADAINDISIDKYNEGKAYGEKEKKDATLRLVVTQNSMTGIYQADVYIGSSSTSIMRVIVGMDPSSVTKTVKASYYYGITET